MTFGSHITRAMCVNYSYALMFACASLFGAFFQRGGRIARAQEVFDGVTSPPSDASSSFAFEDDYLSSSMSFEGRTRQTMANPAQIGEAALSVLAANPTYEERCFDTPGDGKLPYCWYCDPAVCARTKNYENPDLANTEWCPSEACNGYKDEEKWEGYDFGCGFERNWCQTGTGAETKAQCQEKYRRTETNCNCDPENLIACPSEQPSSSLPSSPFPPPPSPLPVFSNTNGEEGGDNLFTNVEVTTIEDDDQNGLFSSPPSPMNEASSTDSGFMQPAKLGGAAVGLIGIFLLAAFVGYRNYICAKLMPRWYKRNANANTTSDEENVPPEWVSPKKNKRKKKKYAPPTPPTAGVK